MLCADGCIEGADLPARLRQLRKLVLIHASRALLQQRVERSQSRRTRKPEHLVLRAVAMFSAEFHNKRYDVASIGSFASEFRSFGRLLDVVVTQCIKPTWCFAISVPLGQYTPEMV